MNKEATAFSLKSHLGFVGLEGVHVVHVVGFEEVGGGGALEKINFFINSKDSKENL
jgi:hypothetical protein